MMAFSSPLSRKRAANRHQLLHDLAFTRLTVVNPCLAFQCKRGAAKRAAVTGVKEVPPQGIDRPRMPTIAGGSFSLKSCDCRIRSLDEPTHPKENVISIFGLLPACKRVQLQDD